MESKVQTIASESPNPPTRVMLWCQARSRSTVFELAMASVPLFQVIHEPYIIADNYGEERRYQLSPEKVSGYSYAEVKCTLEANFPGKKAVFVKDLPVTLQGNMDNLPTGYLHTFLIRDPKSTILSYYKMALKCLPKSNTDFKSTGYLEYMSMKPTFDLYRYVMETLHQKPIIIDSDDLLHSPREVIQKYCNATGLPFHESMLNWTPGNTGHWFPKFLENPSHLGYFTHAIASSCFQQPQTTHSASSAEEEIEFPTEISEVLESNQPIYDELYKHKL
ncbi:uncharacterized protein LOC144446580 [Glandiceps talaboti]